MPTAPTTAVQAAPTGRLATAPPAETAEALIKIPIIRLVLHYWEVKDTDAADVAPATALPAPLVAAAAALEAEAPRPPLLEDPLAAMAEAPLEDDIDIPEDDIDDPEVDIDIPEEEPLEPLPVAPPTALPIELDAPPRTLPAALVRPVTALVASPRAEAAAEAARWGFLVSQDVLWPMKGNVAAHLGACGQPRRWERDRQGRW